jgi:hypothetical protein
MKCVPESSVRKVWPEPYSTVLVRLSEDTGVIPRLGTRHSKSGLVIVIVGLGIVRPIIKHHNSVCDAIFLLNLSRWPRAKQTFRSGVYAVAFK